MPSLQSYFWRFLIRRLTDWSLPLAEQRRRMEESSRRYKIPAGIRCTPVQQGELRAEWVEPGKACAEQVILYVHGGGYFAGSCNTHRPFAAQLAKASGARVFLVEYRLAPEHVAPAALEDALAAYAWLLEMGIEARQIVIMGDSAGGGLALSATVALRDAGHSLPAKIVLMSPLVDLALTGDSMMSKAAVDPWVTRQALQLTQHYLAGESPLSAGVSPLYADLHGLPPTLIQVGSDEILLDDSVRLAHRIKAAGGQVELQQWARMWHVFQLFAPYLPEANRAVRALSDFAVRPVGVGQCRS